VTVPPAVSVVLPVYRNGPTLPELHRRLVATLIGPLQAFEIIYVNDHSPDGSLKVLHALAAEDGRVRVIALDARGGQHAALAAGLRAATGQAVITMDADLQDPPEAIPRLVAMLGQGYGAVYAGRRGRYESWGRLATSRVFKRAMSLIAGMPDDAGAFIAMRRDVAHQAAALPGRAPYVPAAVALAGRPVASIPIVRESRDEVASSYTSGLRVRTAARAIVQALRWRIARVAR
jgi:glycosyltransferase involved in cell wall biosynthesis